MSYNDPQTTLSSRSASAGSGVVGNEEDEHVTEEEKEVIANLPASTFRSFVSPVERKRRQKAKMEEERKKKEAEEAAAAKQRQDTSADNGIGGGHESAEDILKAAEVDKRASTPFLSSAERKRRQQQQKQPSQNIDSHPKETKPDPPIPKSSPFEEESTSSATTNPSSNLSPSKSSSTNHHAASPESTVPSTASAPQKSKEQDKRKAIHAVMKDTTLSPVERNQKIQHIITGNFDVEKEENEVVASVPPQDQVEAIAAAGAASIGKRGVSFEEEIVEVVATVDEAAELRAQTEKEAREKAEAELLYQKRSEEIELHKMQIEQQKKALELQMEEQKRAADLELQRQLDRELQRQRDLELEQQRRQVEFQLVQQRIQEEEENRRQAELKRLEDKRVRDLESQQQQLLMLQQLQAQQEQSLQASRAIGASSAITMASNVHRTNYAALRSSSSISQTKSSRYDGVEDDELNWRLDSYASLSDFTIVVNRAMRGILAPDFDVEGSNSVNRSAIDFVVGTDGSLSKDVYHVHKVMLAVGNNRSELLGRRIREAENTFRGWGGSSPDDHSSDINVHETIMLEGAADAMGAMLDFCYYPDRPLDIFVENAVPLVYLAQRYKIRSLLEKAEAFVDKHLESTNAVHFLLDAYLYKLDDILRRAIDVTAAHLDERVDFDPIYKLPPELFRRIVLSPDLECDSEMLSLVVYSYCGEHHSEEIDVEYFREITKCKIMPELDAKVALMILKFYVDLIFDDDEDCEIMEILQGDSLSDRCITVVSKHWQDEICEPLMIDTEWDESTPSRRSSPHEPASLHRSLPPKLQNVILEKCLLEAKDDLDTEQTVLESLDVENKVELAESSEKFGGVIGELRDELVHTKSKQQEEVEDYRKQIEDLKLKALEFEAELEQRTKALEEYKKELTRFRRVPGIHNFGEVSKADSSLIDKTKCTYSANPDHHYPNHRRGSRPPTQMPRLVAEFGNLGKENGYVYNDGHGQLLPVFYYQGDLGEL